MGKNAKQINDGFVQVKKNTGNGLFEIQAHKKHDAYTSHPDTHHTHSWYPSWAIILLGLYLHFNFFFRQIKIVQQCRKKTETKPNNEPAGEEKRK